MGLFGIGSSSPFDADVENATSEKNTAEQWDVIIDICDKVGANSKNAKDCLRSIMKRMGHADPHVALQAITLLDACIKNCGQKFHLEIASRDFETEFRRLLTKVPPAVSSKMYVSLKKWAENEFKTDSELNLIPTLYNKLKSEGSVFVDTVTAAPKVAPVSKDPNVVSSQQEEDDIAKAIELSLKDKGEGAKASTNTFQSLYPSMSLNGSIGSPGKIVSKPQPEARKVRALYDFEAAEDNELTFFTGEMIHVLDDSDPNWWKGYNDRGEGLFPSNFVSADLSAEPESSRMDNKSKRMVQFAEEEQQKIKEEAIEINEAKIDRLLHLLHEANPEDPSQDSAEMFLLEAQVNQMLPLIDAELERVDRNHAKLTQLSGNLVDAINMYHTLMRDADFQMGNYGMGMNPQQLYGQTGQLYGVHAGRAGHNMYSLPSNVPMTHSMSHPMSIPNAMMPGFGGPMQQAVMPQQQQMLPPHLQNGHQNLQHPSHINQTNPVGLHQIPQSNALQQPQQAPPQLQHLQQFQQQLQQPPQQQPPNQQGDHLQQMQSGAINLVASPGHHNAQPTDPSINVTGGNVHAGNPALIQQQSSQQMPHQAQNASQHQHIVTSHNIPNVNGLPTGTYTAGYNGIHGGPIPQHFHGGQPAHPQQSHLLSGQMHPTANGNNIVSSFPPNTVMTTHIQGAPAGSVVGSPLQQNNQHVRASPIHNNMVGGMPNMAAINQPVTSTILPQSDSRTNIPVYQQQR